MKNRWTACLRGALLACLVGAGATVWATSTSTSTTATTTKPPVTKPPVTKPSVTLTALTEQLPPLNMEVDGKVVGFATELLDLIAADAGVAVRKQVLPWARAYDRVLRQSDALIYSMVRTPERENLFRWVGPISPRRVVLYRWADRTDIELKTLDDARPYRIGTTVESASTKLLERQGFLPLAGTDAAGGGLELGVNDEVNMRKFIAKRFDLLVSLDWAAAHNAKNAGIDPVALVPALVLDESSAYWFGLNPGIAPEVVHRLNQALLRCKADGRYQQLRQKYLLKNAR